MFRLLEQIFWEFDDLAFKLGVFKLGTIGDCYIAVTGIPVPVADHAIVLTQFAFEAREKVRQVCQKLEREGLDTARLDMRFGIHSGATTAGILRGTKSRFELVSCYDFCSHCVACYFACKFAPVTVTNNYFLTYIQ